MQRLIQNITFKFHNHKITYCKVKIDMQEATLSSSCTEHTRIPMPDTFIFSKESIRDKKIFPSIIITSWKSSQHMSEKPTQTGWKIITNHNILLHISYLVEQVDLPIEGLTFLLIWYKHHYRSGCSSSG